MRCKWIPHRLTPQQKAKRKNVCLQLLAKHRRGRLLSNLITCDESWVYYDGTVKGIVWRKSGEQTAMVARPSTHQKKRMLCIFWTMRGPVHWELLPRGVSVTSDVYCQQLNQVDLAIRVWRSNNLFNGPVIFQDDNAPPHRSQQTSHLVSDTLGWQTVPHPPYSPDLAPSDFHLFRSLKCFLRNRQFKKDDEVEAAVGQYLASKMGSDFFKKGIRKLPKRWKKVVDNQGNYFIE